ncbi:MAG: 4a-hydroxytetrahydrobiopterin dehydratase [Flavobacteriaceae bacterium]|nr:4a-hydroxytetrahydrobiopterin dehydratase [Flavobacteriaceae bacterium]|tara:strand:+ start:1142 stop:1423 length:282 start_codon:yes stop_codon:yes gene_type:complete
MSNNLSKSEINKNLKSLNSNWKLVDNKIQREFIFKDFLSAFNFIKELADLAEILNHHPDIFNSYNKVIISLTTHDLGGVSKKDFKLAMEIDNL